MSKPLRRFELEDDRLRRIGAHERWPGDALGKKSGHHCDIGGRERPRQRLRESVSLRARDGAETLFGFPVSVLQAQHIIL